MLTNGEVQEEGQGQAVLMAYRPPHHIFPWLFWSAFFAAGLTGILAIAGLFIA